MARGLTSMVSSTTRPRQVSKKRVIGISTSLHSPFLRRRAARACARPARCGSTGGARGSTSTVASRRTAPPGGSHTNHPLAAAAAGRTTRLASPRDGHLCPPAACSSQSTPGKKKGLPHVHGRLVHNPVLAAQRRNVLAPVAAHPEHQRVKLLQIKRAIRAVIFVCMCGVGQCGACQLLGRHTPAGRARASTGSTSSQSAGKQAWRQPSATLRARTLACCSCRKSRCA